MSDPGAQYGTRSASDRRVSGRTRALLIAAAASALAVVGWTAARPRPSGLPLPASLKGDFDDLTLEVDHYMPSPTGAHVAVSLTDAEGDRNVHALWVIPIRGGQRGRPRLVIERAVTADVSSGWSRDGEALFFQSYGSTTEPYDRIWRYDVETGRIQQISEEARRDAVLGSWGRSEQLEDGAVRSWYDGIEVQRSADRETMELFDLHARRDRELPGVEAWLTRREDFPLMSQTLRSSVAEDGRWGCVLAFDVHDVDRSKRLATPADAHNLRNLDGERWTARAWDDAIYILDEDGRFESMLRGPASRAPRQNGNDGGPQ